MLRKLTIALTASAVLSVAAQSAFAQTRDYDSYGRGYSVFASVALVQSTMTAPHAQDRAQPMQLTGLAVVKVEKTSVEGQDGVLITFDKPSAERLRQFTSGLVGERIVFIVNQRRLATLRVLDPLADGNVLLTGQLDPVAVESLFLGGAVVNLEVN